MTATGEPRIRTSCETMPEVDLGDLPRPDKDTIGRPSFRPVLRCALRRVVDVEGPIFEDVAKRRLLKAWCLRPTPRLAAAVDGVLHGRATTREDGRIVLWPADLEPTNQLRFRPPSLGRRRECGDVPMPELVGLAKVVGNDRPRANQRAMAAAMGYSNLHPNVAARLGKAVRIARALDVPTRSAPSATRDRPGGVAQV